MAKLIIDALIFKDNKSHGYQEYLFNLLNYMFLHRELIRYDEVIVACDVNEMHSFRQFAAKFSIKALKAEGHLRILVAQCRLKKQLNLCKNDVILNTYNYAAFFKQCKTVLVVHDLIYLRPRLLPNRLMRMQRNMLVPRSLRQADRVVAISHFTRNDLLQHYRNMKPEMVEVIYNYFNIDKYKLDPNTKQPAVQRQYYLSVSSNILHKNVITLLKAYHLVITHDVNCPDLILVGKKNNMDPACQDLYNTLTPEVKHKIIFREDISNQELGSLYAGCECFILPTLFEGLGMPIVEAMYFRAKLILSDIEICREVAGDNALYFDPLDAGKLADIFISRRYDELKFNAEQLAKFNSEETSLKYINMLNAI